MARKEKPVIPPNEIVTVVAENDKEVVVKDMPYIDAKKAVKKKSGYKYRIYQKDFCTIKSHKKE